MRRLAAAALLGLGLAATPALAHVEVLPHQAVLEQAQEFTLRVPTERPLPTTAVSVTFPPQVTVYAFAPPPPGWHMTIRERAGQNVGVRYFGSRIPVQQYIDFHFLGTPTKQGTAVWKALQTYADGKVKPWTGKPQAPGAVSTESGPTSPGPASATTITKTPVAATASVASTSSGGSSDAGVWLGLIAIAIAAAAAVGTGLLWGTRPMKLPTDEPGDDAGKRAPTGTGATGGRRRR
jgi:periplasmic copper chaperone A